MVVYTEYQLRGERQVKWRPLQADEIVDSHGNEMESDDMENDVERDEEESTEGRVGEEESTEGRVGEEESTEGSRVGEEVNYEEPNQVKWMH